MTSEIPFHSDERLTTGQNLFDQPGFEKLTILGINNNALPEVRKASFAMAHQFIDTLSRYHAEDFPEEPVNVTHILWTDRENVELAFNELTAEIKSKSNKHWEDPRVNKSRKQILESLPYAPWQLYYLHYYGDWFKGDGSPKEATQKNEKIAPLRYGVWRRVKDDKYWRDPKVGLAEEMRRLRLAKIPHAPQGVIGASRNWYQRRSSETLKNS
jgi:hypothetical protein